MLFLFISPAWDLNENPSMIWHRLLALWGFVIKTIETYFSLSFTERSLGACVRGCIILFHDSLALTANIQPFNDLLYVYDTKVMPWFFIISFPVCVSWDMEIIEAVKVFFFFSGAFMWRTKVKCLIFSRWDRIVKVKGQNSGRLWAFLYLHVTYKSIALFPLY